MLKLFIVVIMHAHYYFLNIFISIILLQGPDFTLHMMNTVLKWFTVLLYKCQISTWHCQNRKYDIWFQNVYFWWLYVFNSQYFFFSAQNTLCSAQTILQVNLYLMQSRLYFILLFAVLLAVFEDESMPC